jgi:phosphatidylglycerol---prolipoprotein diacylglyceryl transferase
MTPGKLLYALFMVLALVTALALREKSSRPLRQRWALFAGALTGAMLGAKLPFVLLSGEPFFSRPAWFAEGKTILAGLAGGYLGVEIAKLLAGIREKTGDGFAVPLAAAVAVGRWGCFFHGCCGAPLAPVVESVFHASMALVLWRARDVEALRHQRVKLYLIAYAVFRFGMEFVRREPRVAWNLTAYQFGAVALALVMLALWAADERAKRTASCGPRT